MRREMTSYVKAPATPTVSHWALLNALSANGCPVITLGGVSGVLQTVQREDGSGRKFLVTITTTDGPRTVYVTTH